MLGTTTPIWKMSLARTFHDYTVICLHRTCDDRIVLSAKIIGNGIAQTCPLLSRADQGR
jgi:hypothetical protein